MRAASSCAFLSLNTGEGKAAPEEHGVLWYLLCCNYSNSLECKTTTQNLPPNCHRHLRRQRLFQNTDVESCSCCSTGKLKGYFKSIIRIQNKLHVKIGKDLPGFLPGMCPV